MKLRNRVLHKQRRQARTIGGSMWGQQRYDIGAREQSARVILPQLVQRLTPKSRPVLLLHYWEGLTLEAVADVQSIDLHVIVAQLVGAVQAHLHLH